MKTTKYFVVVNASNIEKDWNIFLFIMKNSGLKMTIFQMKLLPIAIQGPKAVKPFKKLTDTNFLKFRIIILVGTVAGVENVLFQTLVILVVAVLKFISKRKCRKTLG